MVKYILESFLRKVAESESSSSDSESESVSSATDNAVSAAQPHEDGEQILAELDKEISQKAAQGEIVNFLRNETPVEVPIAGPDVIVLPKLHFRTQASPVVPKLAPKAISKAKRYRFTDRAKEHGKYVDFDVLKHHLSKK